MIEHIAENRVPLNRGPEAVKVYEALEQLFAEGVPPLAHVAIERDIQHDFILISRHDSAATCDIDDCENLPWHHDDGWDLCRDHTAADIPPAKCETEGCENDATGETEFCPTHEAA